MFCVCLCVLAQEARGGGQLVVMRIGRRVPNVHTEGHLCLDNCGNYPGLTAINKPAQRPSPLSRELQEIQEQKRQENIEK